MSAIILIMMTAGCSQPKQSNTSNTPAINPNAEAANKDTAEVTLYFSYMGENFLAGETRTINVPVNTKTEYAVIQELLAGPSTGRDDLTGLFWGNVKLVNVDSVSDILLVTLSNDFVTTSPPKVSLEDGSIADQKKLAIYSIVDTIVQMGNYSRVQIEVDREVSKIGERITQGEAGWAGDASTYLEPVAWDGDLVLTPENTLTEALKSFGTKDWTRLYDFTAYNNPDGTVKPDISAFSDALSTPGNLLQSYKVNGTNVSADGQKAVALLDYTISTRAGDTIERTDIPVVMVRENDIWKLSYTSLVNILINVG